LISVACQEWRPSTSSDAYLEADPSFATRRRGLARLARTTPDLSCSRDSRTLSLRRRKRPPIGCRSVSGSGSEAPRCTRGRLPGQESPPRRGTPSLRGGRQHWSSLAGEEDRSTSWRLEQNQSAGSKRRLTLHRDGEDGATARRSRALDGGQPVPERQTTPAQRPSISPFKQRARRERLTRTRPKATQTGIIQRLAGTRPPAGTIKDGRGGVR